MGIKMQLYRYRTALYVAAGGAVQWSTRPCNHLRHGYDEQLQEPGADPGAIRSAATVGGPLSVSRRLSRQWPWAFVWAQSVRTSYGRERNLDACILLYAL
jgi:hypothetical protein